MAVLKCKMCGGELTIREGVSIVKCDYCGNTNTLPKENSVNNHDLFARANELRVRCEFDLAERAYEKIIEVAPQEAEAYWGLVLCKYGIEYVEDPKTKKRIPTCHRASFEAITADYNYQKAIEYADVVSRPVYEEEARVIDAIQKEILALSYKEEKYDVFICYKETDDSGKRTEDSAIANDIYYQLTQEGYKVFYAAITLEDKLGQDYEPIIFAALNSAKVMLVVGTKAEYFNAVWVKNEWSRFLKIMKQDRTKLMFPCYKGISAYELPDELSHMQAQDMGKIGFINDLIRGIKKVIVKEKPKTEASSEVAATKVAPSKMNPTLRRAFIFIEDGNWEEANEYLEKVLDDEPENAFAYLGKLLIDLKVKKQEKLADLAQTFDNNPNYKKAYKFADKELKEKLAGYNEAISKRNEEKSKDEQYSAALTFASKAKTEEDYKQAGKKFAALSGWKDSSRRAKDCFDKAETIRKDAIYTKALGLAQSKDPNTIKQAIPLFESIPDWKDSAELLIKIPELCEVARKNSIYEDADRKYNSTNIAQVKEAQVLFLSIETWRDSKQKAESCVKRIQELEEKAEQERIAHEKAERERRIAAEKKKKLIKKVSIISGSAVVAIVTVIILLVTLIIPTIKFNKATELFNAGKYDEAVEIYNELDGFGNSNNKLNVIEGINTVEDGDYEEGIEKLLENGAIVTISYDCAGGDLSTNNTKSVKANITAYSLEMIIASADEQGNNFTYNSLNEFEGLKPSTRNGYDFKKWALVSCEPTITKDFNNVSLAFVAEWTAKSYTVTYDLDGGSVNGENIIGYNPDDEAFTLINPTRTGYTFIGWTGTDLTEKTMEVTVASGSYGNREYTANWQANTYTVTYNANGGVSSKTEDTATYDEGFTLATVERKGYTFLGWFVGETKYEDFENWERTEGLNLKAKWQINTYNITYTLNGGNVTNTETYTVEDTVVINAPEKTGYTFDGWTGTGLSEETKSVTLAKGTIGDKEYIANWTAKTYTVTFNANGGTASKTEDTATYDSNFTLATAERKGYEFIGWKADGVTYTSGDWETDKNVDLVAEWKIKNYEITYHLDGGSVECNPATYTLNDTVTLINPTKIGYTFTGWTGTDLNSKTMTVTIAKDSIDNREFTATWTANTYKVTYNANGGTASKLEDSATFDGDFTLATAERKGYDFVAWKADGETFANGSWKTAKDIELVAEWKIINYSITYDLDGGSVSGNPNKYTVEDTVMLIAPERTGYTFAGWTGTGLTDRTMSVAISKGSISEREYTANWTANTYTLTYEINGGDALSDNTQSVIYDANYSVITPTRTGYSFVKWATSTGMVYSGGTWKTANDVTVIAEWSANTYTVNYNGNGGTPTKTSDTATYDKTFTLTTASRTGYEFVYWKYNGEEFTSGKWDLTTSIMLVAEWSPIAYTITYNLDGGTSNNPNTYTIEDEITLSIPEKAGYTFVGWTGTDLFNETMSVTISLGSIGSREYTANWEANEYKITYFNTNSIYVTFDYNGLNKENKIIALNEAQDFVLEENVLRDGYIFRGWYTDKNATKAFDYNTIINSDITLYAGWYKLETGDRRDNLVITNSSFSFSRSMDRYSYPTYTYPYFVAKKSGTHILTCRGSGSELWKVSVVITNLTTGQKIYEDTPSSSSSTPTIISFNCQQGDVVQIYTSTGFSSNGSVYFYFTYNNFDDGNVLLWNEDVVYFEQEYISQDIVYDEEYIAYKPYRNGYVFDAWYDENGNKYENGIWKTAKDVELTAKWIPNSYTVVYNSGLGVASKESQTVIMGENTTLATATRDGYDFLGWYYNGVLVSNGEWIIADNITLEAKWELEYKTPYQVNHYKQNIEDDNYTLFEELNLLGQINQVVTPTVNTYEGFTSPSAKTVTVLEDGSVVVEYYYTRNKYQLKYVSNGGTVDSTAMVKYGTPLSLAVPEKDNRTFGGWFTDIGLTNRFTQSTMPAQATTLYAWWQEETKANVFMCSGTSTVTISKYIGASNSIVIPSHIAGLPVTTIASEAFLDNQVITSIIVPNTVTTIQTKAFSGCTNLTSIVLPISLASVEEQAFFGCSSLATVYYMGTSTDWSNISIVSNFYLTNANRYYYSKEEPALNSDSTSYNGNYWRYVGGVPTPWIYEG